jgi:hypothetical protein
MRYARRMSRSFRPAFVATFTLSALACQESIPPEPPVLHVNPPPPPEEDAAPPEVTPVDAGATTTVDAGATETPQALKPVDYTKSFNPKDKQGRTIYFGGNATCYVELPFKTPPTSVMPPPTAAVACPGEMLRDPAWQKCVGGTMYGREGGGPNCSCAHFGNPPPPPSDAPCPK